MLTRRNFLQLMGASGMAATGAELLAQRAALAAPAKSPLGSNGIEHVVILMMENRSFDHFLGWLPGVDGRHDLEYLSTNGNTYRNYPLAPDFQGCGYSDPDHSWEGWLVQHNYGKMNGFLQRPTTPAGNAGVKLAAANTFPIGYYTNLNPDGSRKAEPDIPVIGALAEHYTVLDRYFCSFAGETFPNRFYQHAAQTDRDHNSEVISKLPSIWDHLSPIPNKKGVPTGGYFFRDLPFLGLWGVEHFAFWHMVYGKDADALGIKLKTKTFFETVEAGELPNVSYVDPAFDFETTGTSADDHPLAHIRLGERFIADVYHALAKAGYLRNTVFVINFDEWGGFYEHVLPPHVVDHTNPKDVNHSGDGKKPTDGRLIPDYTQLGFRVPAIVVSDLSHRHIVSDGPYEHTSILALIESTFGIHPLTARDAHARNLGELLSHEPRRHVLPKGAIPTSAQVGGPANDAVAVCGAHSVQSVSPPPVKKGNKPFESPLLYQSGYPSGSGMVNFGQEFKKAKRQLEP
jgi:phospholipase C